MDHNTSEEEEQIVMAFIEQHVQFMAQLDADGRAGPQSDALWDYGDPEQFDPQPVAAPPVRRAAQCSYDRPRRAGRS